MSDKSVLIVDDDPNLGRAIKLNLDGAGFRSALVGDLDAAWSEMSSGSYDVILCDHLLPGDDGLSFVKKCNLLYPTSSVILMTGYGDRDLAVAALKAGAYDYLSKPFPIEELLITLKKLDAKQTLEEENRALKSEVKQTFDLGKMVGHSESLRKVFELAKRVAAFDSTVLITGESGTGKELLARAIHDLSPRSGKPFIAVNCGAVPENLMESEFFGHKKGAFTDAYQDRTGLFDEANGGTIFLDEIGEMPIHLQVKLLRVLQEQQIQRIGEDRPRPISVRVVAATLRNLQNDVKAGRFREDLFYRLNVINLALPPLRERFEDLPILIDHFVKKYNTKLGTRVQGVSAAARHLLAQYPWPGNVRELENSIERAMVMVEGEQIEIEHFPQAIVEKSTVSAAEQQTKEVPATQNENLNLSLAVATLEQAYITKALQKSEGNRVLTAEILGISLRSLMYKIKTYNLKS